jgi:hypothetical protein
MHSTDPTQALLTIPHKEVKKAVAKNKKNTQSLENQLSYLQAMLDPNLNTQADWLDKYTNMKTW